MATYTHVGADYHAGSSRRRVSRRNSTARAGKVHALNLSSGTPGYESDYDRFAALCGETVPAVSDDPAHQLDGTRQVRAGVDGVTCERCRAIIGH